MATGNTLFNSSALAGGVLAAMLFGGVAQAQDAPAQQPGPDDEAEQVEDVIVTGSRIPQNEFTSPSPLQVLTSERAEQRGLNDTAQLLQSSTLAAGSPQVNSTISTAFVTDGGPGAATISLRGLGANRTLVLLNGRRAGPAGVRGGVSSFDLNVIPQSAISRIDVLKDGASSIYGSDAVAGVVNLITDRARDGGEMGSFVSLPFESGGEQYNLSGTYGKTFDRGHLNISGDYYRQVVLRQGDRDYLDCTNHYVFQPGTNIRADRIDPRTGRAQCLDSSWGQIYVYGPDFSGRAGRFQFDYDGDLGNYIPTRPTNPAVSATYPVAPAGFYLVNYDPASRAVINNHHPEFAEKASIIPEVERYTAFIEGAYDVGGGMELYAEVLLNRRESRTESYRQFWNYTLTSDFLDYYYGPGAGGDPVTGFTGLNILSATPATDHYDQSQRVDYARAVVGLRGQIGSGFLQGWNWDLFGQYSRSKGTYFQEVILDDAVDSTTFKTSSCVGTNLPISGRPCIDVDFTDPRFLRGDFTDAERAFLFDEETGVTLYEQTYVEGSLAGHLFDLPAGPLGMAVGFHLRRDEIVDTPGDVSLAGNSWGLSSAGITEGSDDTSEVYAELAIPLLNNPDTGGKLDLSLSGRYTDTKTSGGATTYKIGLNWALNDAIRFRGTYGTSFRAPALFELYLSDQTSFLGQNRLDPCTNLDIRLASGQVTQEIYDNCRNPAGPGGGVGGAFTGGVSSTEILTGGGLGVLEPETSTAAVFGVVLTPPDSNLSVAVDYFDIQIENEVLNLGAASLLLACYTSDNFPNDPICNQFDRDPNLGVTQVRDSFINIANQSTRGLDLTVRYGMELPWGRLVLDSQTTWTFENYTAVFEGVFTDPLGQVGNPELVGNINATFTEGPWTLFWGFDWIGHQSNKAEYLRTNALPTIDGVTVDVKAEAEFTSFHSLSATYEFGDWSLLAGVANVFDELPPAASTQIGQYSTQGNSILASQYSEAMYGRRAFFRISRSF